MKKCLIIILAIFLSCKKNTSQPFGDLNTLMAHSWYPYQMRIISTGYNSTTTYDSLGNSHVQSTPINSDTTFIVDQCNLQSTYSFEQNGRLAIKDKCSLTNISIDTLWQITQTNQLYFPAFEYFGSGLNEYPVGGSGLITQINNSQFTFNNWRSSFYSMGPINGVITIFQIEANFFVTYKSK